VCQIYALQPIQIKSRNISAAEQVGGANVHSRSVKRKRKHVNIVSLCENESLADGDESFDTEDVVGGENTGHLQPCSFNPSAVPTRLEMSSDTVIRQSAIVAYSSSSEDEDLDCSTVLRPSTESTGSQVLPSNTTGCETVTKKRRIDCKGLLASADRHKEETALLLNSSDEGPVGKCRTLDKAMTVLSELRSVVSRLVAKSMFPFNVQPLLRHLHRCEVLYTANRYMI